MKCYVCSATAGVTNLATHKGCEHLATDMAVERDDDGAPLNWGLCDECHAAGLCPDCEVTP